MIYGFVEILFLSCTWCALEKVAWVTRRTHIPFAFLSEFYPVQFFSQSYTCLFWNPALFLCEVFIWKSLAQLWARDRWLMWLCRAISQDSCVLPKALFRACVYFFRFCHPCWGTLMVLEAATVDTFHILTLALLGRFHGRALLPSVQLTAYLSLPDSAPVRRCVWLQC